MFRRGDATKLDFPDESFDAVVSNYVYHNIPVKDRQAVLMETLRVLKKGGTFALHDIYSKLKYGDMQAFVLKLNSMGYEKVQLIDTANGKFIKTAEEHPPPLQVGDEFSKILQSLLYKHMFDAIMSV